MLRSIIRILPLLGLCPIWLNAQQNLEAPADSLRRSEEYGIRLGVDLSRPLITFLDDAYEGFEVVGDYRLTHHWYLAAELGNESRDITEELGNLNDVNVVSIYEFTSAGSYLKVGADYNTYQNWYGMNNSIVVGARYAFSTFTTDLNSFRYFNSNRYWSPDGFQPGTDLPRELSGLNASWLEALIGIKTELFGNIYLGASLRIGLLISRKESELMPHIWIPGFNRVNDTSSFGVGFNYSISYLLPLYRKARIRPPEE